MYSYFISVAMLISAYFIYGKYLEKNFGVDSRDTPVTTMNDGVDYVEINWKKALLIQFLNIAGLGPVTGAIAGAMWGPAAFLWIVFGCIFAGSVHDYYAGLISMRHSGKNIPELIGKYLGKGAERFIKIVTVILLIIVGIAFITGPAEIMKSYTGISKEIWLLLIAIYYIIATMLPIDKIIGKIYPIFGASLIIMVVALMASLLIKGYSIPEVSFQNLHPAGKPIFPFMFVVISCGAISGFHSTQSVLMGRCLKSEFSGRKAFYGAMIIEGIVALTWAAIAIAFFGGTEGLAQSGGGMVAISEISKSLLGKAGIILVGFGVIALPISTGDTAFRSARLTIADAVGIEQKSFKNRILVSAPLFLVAGFMSQLGFTTLWRYVAFTNQILATFTLWMCTYFLIKNNKNMFVTGVPASFMTGVMTCYILMAPEGLRMTGSVPYFGGVIVGIVSLVLVINKNKVSKNTGYLKEA